MGGDATNWDESAYRASIAKERELQARTVFRTIFAPSQNPIPETIVAASSDGSVAPYSISSCISSSPPAHLYDIRHQKVSSASIVAEPRCLLQGHDGPAYDVKFYGQGEDSLLLSCGDDGRIQGWRWKEILNSDLTHASHMRGNHLMSVLDLVNPQHRGPWGALSPTPENNAIAVDDQIITGSEDGTVRMWDCKSGKCTYVINPQKNVKLKAASSWISCIALDINENWLAFSTDKSISIWNLPTRECISMIGTHSLVQDILFEDNQILAVGAEPALSHFNLNGAILSQVQCAPQSAFSISRHPSGVMAVGGYGGLVDVISQFGSHLCTFRCGGC
ncbi:hypothetical protein Scep_007855 [Stephania cephalantha]|uniref:THO complex subunit 6 n=1 Tax=Stephania cephalantha TaxID=152367 RepID=A0AAP0KAM2_9MAGN